MALVARALAGMPAQTRCPVSVDAAQTCSRRGRHRTSPRHASELLGYLERNEGALVHYAPSLACSVARRRCGEPISTAFVESAVNEIVAKRMNKKQQMRWNRATVQPFLVVRTAVLNDTLEDAFRHRYLGFRSANNDEANPATSAHV